MISMQERGDLLADGRFDAAAALDRLAERTAQAVRRLGRRGAVVAVSGGVDSGVVAGICVRALGPEHVLLPAPARARHRRSASSDLGLELARGLGAPHGRGADHGRARGPRVLSPPRRGDPRGSSPTTSPSWRHKLVRSAPTGGDHRLLARRRAPRRDRRSSGGCPPDAYRELLAATNMKQRVRKLIEYTWADRLGYAVVGTPNLLEYDQGFFVKGGDGLADVKPIAGLYKAQVYALARELGLPEAIADAPPTTETFSLPQTQEEFYFGHPYDQMDLLRLGARRRASRRLTLAARVGMDGRGGRGRLPRDRAPARGDRVPARRQRCSSTRRRADVCGIAGIVRPHGRGSRSTRRRSCRMARAIRHRGPDGYGLALDAGRRPRLDPARDLRHPAAAGSRSMHGANGDAARLQRRGLQPPRASATSSSGAASVRDHAATPRSSCACSSATASTRSTASTASSRSPGGSRATAGSRWCATASASARCTTALLDDGTLVFGSEAKALFASGEVSRRPDLAGIDEVFTLWGPRPPRTAFAGVRSCRPAACSSGSDGEIVERAEVVGARRTAVGGAGRPGSCASCCATACGCACGPTCPSAPTSPAASTRA